MVPVYGITEKGNSIQAEEGFAYIRGRLQKTTGNSGNKSKKVLGSPGGNARESSSHVYCSRSWGSNVPREGRKKYSGVKAVITKGKKGRRGVRRGE